ncbi:hypothetical protein LSH36_67g02063 [Paralvinella palmiformis]|uniref:Uncharacterized protein n=1 Tax=Paralvinella palmiformis TaxID=53620 RepID=A0AAD9NDG7_9ANNE|nr:hypothetical protein LSH36_67g02063 [Paralvinella palmiformis]
MIQITDNNFLSPAECRLHCYECATSTLPSMSRQDCLDGKAEFVQCGTTDKYCVMLRYTEHESQGHDQASKVVLRRGCSPEFLGNYCQYRTLRDGTQSSVCVSTCAESGCNNLPSTVDMDGYMDFFGRRR